MKKYLALLLAVCMVLAMAACAAKQPAASDICAITDIIPSERSIFTAISPKTKRHTESTPMPESTAVTTVRITSSLCFCSALFRIRKNLRPAHICKIYAQSGDHIHNYSALSDFSAFSASLSFFSFLGLKDSLTVSSEAS